MSTTRKWTVDDSRAHRDEFIKIKEDKFKTIAELPFDGALDRDFIFRQYNNARLIAAAPEMLEILQRVLIRLDVGTDTKQLESEAAKLIEKITGEKFGEWKGAE